jgi:hypothetical protein
VAIPEQLQNLQVAGFFFAMMIIALFKNRAKLSEKLTGCFFRKRMLKFEILQPFQRLN